MKVDRNAQKGPGQTAPSFGAPSWIRAHGVRALQCIGVGLFLSGAGVACSDLIDPDDEPLFTGCSGSDPTANVSGFWTLRGFGNRSDCEDEELDVEGVELQFQTPVSVVQTADGLLVLSDPTKFPSLSFGGQVSGSCVDFQIIDASSNGSLDYSFRGNGSANVQIFGNFRSNLDPDEGCVTQGSFTVAVAP